MFCLQASYIRANKSTENSRLYLYSSGDKHSAGIHLHLQHVKQAGLRETSI